MLSHIIYSAIATLCFALTFNIKGEKLFFTAICGSISWGTFLITQEIGYGKNTAYFLSAVALSIFAEIFARHLKTPVTSLLVSGLIPLVPGGGMYYTMYNIINNKPQEAFNTGMGTISAAGSLAMGIVVVASIAKATKNFKNLRLL